MSTQDRTGLVYFAAPGWSLEDGHPECEERLLSSYKALQHYGILDLPQVQIVIPRPASDLDIARTHVLVPTLSAQVNHAQRMSAGSVLALADALMHKEIHNGYALVRPPGHHAMRVVHGNRGFCSINNMAMLVNYLRSQYGIKRIAIVDTDVHHGDGTQDIFWHDPDVLVIGLHQDGRTLYPGTGFLDELGGPGAYACNLNVPLPMETGDAGYLYVLEHLIQPVLADFQAEIVLQSAGLDNHFTDQLSMMQVTAQGYACFVDKLQPDLVLLEGGYAVETALPFMNAALVLALAGESYDFIVEPGLDDIAMVDDTHILPEIETMVGILLEAWQNREADINTSHASGEDTVSERDKDIYYDTDNIMERQRERVRLCDTCAGWVNIESHARATHGTQRAWSITLPFGACPTCRREAELAYAHIKAIGFRKLDVAIFQDQDLDEVYQFDFDTQIESALHAPKV